VVERSPYARFKPEKGDADVNSCAVDPTSDNIAVAEAATDDPGDVVIFDAHTGKPTSYFDKRTFSYEFVVYDARRNLFVDGISRDESSDSMSCQATERSQSTSRDRDRRTDPRATSSTTVPTWW
jgi:hypothetical protein